jgi:hypothetical protein
MSTMSLPSNRIAGSSIGDEYVKLAPSTGDWRVETGHLIAVADLMPNSWASPHSEARKCNVHDRTNVLAITEAGRAHA